MQSSFPIICCLVVQYCFFIVFMSSCHVPAREHGPGLFVTELVHVNIPWLCLFLGIKYIITTNWVYDHEWDRLLLCNECKIFAFWKFHKWYHLLIILIWQKSNVKICGSQLFVRFCGRRSFFFTQEDQRLCLSILITNWLWSLISISFDNLDIKILRRHSLLCSILVVRQADPNIIDICCIFNWHGLWLLLIMDGCHGCI